MGAAQLLPIVVALAVPFLLARWGTGYTLLAGILALAACLVPFALGAQSSLQTQSLLQTVLLIGAPYLAASATFSVIRASRNLFSQEMVIPRWRAHSQGTATAGPGAGLIGHCDCRRHADRSLWFWRAFRCGCDDRSGLGRAAFPVSLYSCFGQKK